MSAEAVFFGPADRPRFGWRHVPPPGVASTGVGLVIVPPFGYEAVCAFRALRALALRAAAAGVIAVQFDLDGTGDSAGDDLDPDRVGAWRASVDDACELARAAGADRLVLCGVRLGVQLAALTAAERDDVAGLVAIAAVPSGKALVRELTALHRAAGVAPPPDGSPADDEIVGFALAPATRAAITALDLGARSPAPAVLVLDRADRKANDAWCAALTAAGAAVTHRALPGYPEMVLDPHHAQIPDEILAAAIAFAAARPALAAARPARALVAGPRAQLGDVVEEAVTLPGGLRGIASRPASTTAAPARALVLLNAGAIRWIGPNRLSVTLARRLAARGWLVLRADLAGLGASPARGADHVVYADGAVAEVGELVAWARAQGARTVAVAGLCSGGYHALRAAIAGAPIDTVVAINPLTFRYEPGMPLDAQPHKVTAAAARYRSSIRSVDAWRKLLRGGVALRPLARTLARRARDVGGQRARDLARRLHVPLPDDLGTELRALAERGAVVRFVFAAGEPGEALLVAGAGRVVPELAARGALAITTIDGPDHTFTPRWSHPVLLDALVRALGAA